MTRHMAEVPTNTWMVPSTLAIGKKINNMDTVLRPGLMLPNMRVITSSERNTESAHSSGLMDLPTSESSTIIIFTGKEFTLGLTIASMRENGEPTRCMARAPLPGLTIEDTLVNTQMIRRGDTVSSYGLMVDAIGANGLTANSMAKELMLQALAKKNMESGKKENV